MQDPSSRPSGPLPPRPVSRSASRRLLSAAWSRYKALRAGLPHDAIFPGVPDDRFQAALSTRLYAAGLTPGRRVLDLAPVLGTGAVLLASGASQVSLVEPDARRRAWLQRHEPEGIEVLAEPPPRPPSPADGEFDLILASFEHPPRTADPSPEWTVELARRLAGALAPRGALVLWQGASATAPPRLGTELSESIAQALADELVTVEHLWHLTPPGHPFRPDDRLPARARAHEYRVVPDAGTPPEADERLGHLWVARTPRRHLPAGPLRLHVGSGDERLEGWLNLDLLPFPAVDVTLDVTAGLPFEDCEAVYAEHFLEHLPIDAALRFLEAAHDALASNGVLRLSTPSLDWTWRTQYEPSDASADDEDAQRAALARAIDLNRAFYGWKHRFLWNRGTLALALAATGFVDLEWPARGESRHVHLRNVERHEASPDHADLPHVLLVEARKGTPRPDLLAELRDRLQQDFLTPVAYLG